ncbi:tetratricopeptide repeat protein [Actinokineospora enzanensis]|uniref:tetratricopeptide repeat protein n=1 Tax=Actinokineospora enzanensis TaxID=155975 RepID=UPI00036C47DC|nr:tetratricopeptide repeat protein [Actinokineospora enzanensis]
MDIDLVGGGFSGAGDACGGVAGAQQRWDATGGEFGDGNAGISYKDVGDFELAEKYLSAAVSIARLEDSRDLVLYLGMLSRLYIKQDRLEEASVVARRILHTRVMSSRVNTQLTLFLTKTNRLNSSIIRELRPQIRAALNV